MEVIAVVQGRDHAAARGTPQGVRENAGGEAQFVRLGATSS
jgi:hypothetical protein